VKAGVETGTALYSSGVPTILPSDRMLNDSYGVNAELMSESSRIPSEMSSQIAETVPRRPARSIR